MAQRVLVLTSEDLADANEVQKSIRPLIDQAEEVYVVAPTLTSWMQWLADDRDNALVSADARLRTVSSITCARMASNPMGRSAPRTRSPRSPMH